MGMHVSIEHVDDNAELGSVNHGEISMFEPLKTWTKIFWLDRGFIEVTSAGRL